MKETPIIFQAEMVRAILDDRKSQTRRVIKPQPRCDLRDAYFDAYNGGPQWNWWLPDNKLCNAHDIIKCPYGMSGDKLWVREIWKLEMHSGFHDFRYRADNELIDAGTKAWQIKNRKYWKWISSIHMPKIVVRIWLEVFSVRVERVQDISEENAQAEGCLNDVRLLYDGFGGPVDYEGLYAVERFEELWNSINAKPKPVKKWFDLPADPGNIIAYVSFPWDESSKDPRTEINGKPHFCYPNPWVWVIEFKEVPK